MNPLDIVDAWENIVKPYFKENFQLWAHFEMKPQVFEDFVPKVDDFLKYLEGTWIGKQKNGRRQSPRFLHSKWNLFERIEAGLPNTNNAIESWNANWNKGQVEKIPNFWNVIRRFKTEDSYSRKKFSDIEQGRFVDKNPTRTKKLNEKREVIKTKLRQGYDKRDVESVASYMKSMLSFV